MTPQKMLSTIHLKHYSHSHHGESRWCLGHWPTRNISSARGLMNPRFNVRTWECARSVRDHMISSQVLSFPRDRMKPGTVSQTQSQHNSNAHSTDRDQCVSMSIQFRTNMKKYQDIKQLFRLKNYKQTRQSICRSQYLSASTTISGDVSPFSLVGSYSQSTHYITQSNPPVNLQKVAHQLHFAN